MKNGLFVRAQLPHFCRENDLRKGVYQKRRILKMSDQVFSMSRNELKESGHEEEEHVTTLIHVLEGLNKDKENKLKTLQKSRILPKKEEVSSRTKSPKRDNSHFPCSLSNDLNNKPKRKLNKKREGIIPLPF